jgi:hypothetical protein
MRSLLFLLLLGSSASAATRTMTLPHGDITLVQQIVPDDITQAADARVQSRLIYLNRTGVTLTPGANDARINTSSLVSAQSSIPAWQTTPALWSETVTCLRNMFAPFDVKLTETDPGSVAHIEAVFGGAAPMLGLPVHAGGVAPFSTACKAIENSIVFAFTDDLPVSSKVICEVMAQELAHSYGLDHELLASDPMTYLSYAGPRSFQNATAECGELTARPCGVTGYASCRANQNSYALLTERLGAAGTSEDPIEEEDMTGASTEDPNDGETDEPTDAVDDAAMGCSSSRGHGWIAGLLVLGVLRCRRRGHA